MNVQYTFVTKNAVSLDRDEIISLLSEYQALSRPVNVMNYYRELPITSSSSLSRPDYGKFEITVSEMHLQVIRQQLQTILYLEGCTVLAECSSVNYQKNSLVISGFRFIELHAAKREAFRLNVDIDADLIVDFRNSEGKIAARMVDISMTGCRIKLESGNVPAGLLVVLEIQIFDSSKDKKLPRSIAAKVVKAYCSDDISYCCLEFIGTPSDQDLLTRYLNQQQTSIIREFREKKVLSA